MFPQLPGSSFQAARLRFQSHNPPNAPIKISLSGPHACGRAVIALPPAEPLMQYRSACRRAPRVAHHKLLEVTCVCGSRNKGLIGLQLREKRWTAPVSA